MRPRLWDAAADALAIDLKMPNGQLMSAILAQNAAAEASSVASASRPAWRTTRKLCGSGWWASGWRKQAPAQIKEFEPMSIAPACIRVSSALALAGLCAACTDPGAVGPGYGYAQQPVQPYAEPYGYGQPVQPYGYAPGYPPAAYGYAPQYEPAPAVGLGVFEGGGRRDYDRHERGEWRERAGQDRELDHRGGDFRPAALPPPAARNAPPPQAHVPPPASLRPTTPQAAANLESLKRLGFQPNR